MDVKIIAQQGDHRYLVDVGSDSDGQELGRVYDLLMDSYGPPVLVGSLRAMSPGWEEPTSGEGVLELVRQKVSGKPRLFALRDGQRVVGDLDGVARQ
jgi:hypothetical protein